MEKFNYEFEGFSTRAGFNKSLGHFRAVKSIVEDMGDNINIADSIYENFPGGELVSGQLTSIVHALLVDKFNYLQTSINLAENNDNVIAIQTEIAKWKAADIVFTYFHPESGIMVLNPKNAKHMEDLGSIKKFELINVYVGAFGNTEKYLADKVKTKLLKTILTKTSSLVEGRKQKATPDMLKGSFGVKKPVKAAPTPKSAAKPTRRYGGRDIPTVEIKTPAAKTGSAPAHSNVRQVQRTAPTGRMTTIGPVAVTVSNELFHNGNVEAWKRIIASYTTKYPDYNVSIYYDGEKIHDINSLFKWGKVKHGTSIMYSVSAPVEKILDVSKLRKYLIQGASQRFEAFLKGPVGKVLELF